MERRSAVGVALAALGFIVLMFVSSSHDVQVFHDPPPSDRRSTPIGAAPDDNTASTLPPATDPANIPDNAIVAGIALVLLAVLVVLIAHAFITTWFRRLRIKRRVTPPRPAGLMVLPDVEPSVVVLDVEAQLRALAEGTPRNAIVACWLRLEDDVAQAGLPRHAAETSAEFTGRVLASLALDPAPVIELGSLYREARFSRHTMDQHHRDRALTALRHIHASLDARTSADATGSAER